MSRNRKQPNKTNTTVNRPAKAQPTEADTVKASLDAAKQSVKKQTEQIQKQAQVGQAQAVADASTTTAETKKATVSSTSQSADNTTSTAKSVGSKVAADKESKQPTENKTSQSDSRKTTQAKKTTAESTAQKTRPTPQPPKPRQKINYAPPEKSPKKGGLVASIALLLGVGGVGLGAYSFNELRHLKATVGDGIKDQVSHLAAELTTLAEKDPTAGIKGQLSTLSSQQKNLVASEERVNQRLAQVEQMQQGFSQSMNKAIDVALSAKLQTVDGLLEKVKSIELSQQGLSKNLSEVNAASQATQIAGMQKQEVGYLLRMADYKIQSEADVLGARGLLKSAESKLLMINQGQTDALVEAIREKIIQLSGVKPVDTNALLSQLKATSRDITHLQAKSTAVASQAADQVTTGEKAEDGMLNKLTSALASGIKYTPKDPNQIDVSAETILIEKRLMQADIKTAELAVQSHNKVLLAESIRSVLDSLDKSFAADETAQAVKERLTTIAQSELETVMPDLTGLVKQFEATQAQ